MNKSTTNTGAQTMFRRILTAVLIVIALASASAAVPGLLETVAVACPTGASNC